MAIVRCKECGQPEETRHRYPYAHAPHAELQLLCGARHCAHPALVWLSDAEERRYQQTDERIFSVVRYRGIEVQ